MKVFANVLIYSGGEFLSKLIPFLLLPIITNYLSPEEVGTYAMILSLSALLVIFVGMSQQAAISRFYYFKEKLEYSSIYNSACIASLVSACAIALVMYFFDSLIANFFELEYKWIVATLLLSFFQVLLGFVQAYFQVSKNAVAYSCIQFFSTFLSLSTAIVLIVYFSLGWQGYIFGVILGVASTVFLSNVYIYRKQSFQLRAASWTEYSEVIKYSLPLVPHNVSTWFKTNGDRFLVASLIGSAIAGVYFVNLQIASIYSICVFVLNRALQPFYYDKLKIDDRNSAGDLKKIIFFHLSALVVGFAIFIFLYDYIFSFIVNGDFILRHDLILIFMITALVQGCYLIISNFVFFAAKNQLILKASLVNLVVYGISMFALFDYLGESGVALVSLICMLHLLVHVAVTSNKAGVFNALKNIQKSKGV
ncbi:hypothetical protein EZV61_05610 [Corallincola luteus]|uniref:Polysaccharide biosynthesis protein n=1 Tax=Corallincola luteus TaxID=1775177 RepID=A0ABY2AT23_9GAMM|nr:oligosaccharide flippase family protein [Corallincola luteus]TCI05427.1 hypothetical protein EZV61_05610 [Corallincola luteus]